VTILHVSPALAPAWAYGRLPHDVAALTRAQAAGGHRVTVLTTDALAPHERLPAGDRIEDGVRVVRVRNVSGVVWTWLGRSTSRGLRPALAALVAEARPDVVHVHGDDAAQARTALGVLGADIPLVWSPHGAAGEGGPSRRGVSAPALGLVRRAAAVVGASRADQQMLETYVTRTGARATPHVVPWGVEPLPAAPEGLLLEAARTEVLYIGRLDDTLTLVRLATAVHERGLRLVVIGGDHGGRARIEQELTAARVRAYVDVAGYVAPAQLSRHLSRAAVVVLTGGTDDRHPLVAAALVHGAPVALVGSAATRGTGAALGAVRAVTDDLEAWRAVLEAWCATPARGHAARLGALGAAQAIAWPACAAAFDAVYAGARALT
jgi:hypothetical protein